MRARTRPAASAAVLIVALAGGAVALAAGVPERILAWATDDAEATFAERDRLTHQWHETDTCHTFNVALVGELVDGRIGLAAAVDQFLPINECRSGYLDALTMQFPAPTIGETIAQSLLVRVAFTIADDPTREDAVLALLDEEYERLYGRPPPIDQHRMAVPLSRSR